MKMTVYFIRHAETPGNLERRYIGGRTDEPLSDEGRAKAAAVTGLPAVDRVYTSPMKRAVETAEIMFPQAEIIPVEGLRETDFGVFEGRNADEMENDPAYRAWVEGFCKDAPPGGEDMAAFVDRTCEAFVSCLEKELKRSEKTVAVVAHGGTIMAVMSRLCTPARSYYDWRLPNCRGYVVETEDGKTLLLRGEI